MNSHKTPPTAALPIKCDFSPCSEDAKAFICWDADRDRRQANVCRAHHRKVWDALRNQIKVGNCWWFQEPPKTDEERRQFNGLTNNVYDVLTEHP